MWSVKGFPSNITEPIIARYSKEKGSLLNKFSQKRIRIINQGDNEYGSAAGLSSEMTTTRLLPMIVGIDKDRLLEIKHGDILRLCPDGSVQKCWDSLSKHNTLYLTDFCNSRCIMCPQPTPEEASNYYDDALKIVSLLDSHELKSLCVTGGEPTLVKSKFIEVMAECRTKTRETSLLVLTNGRSFHNFSFIKEVMLNCPPKTVFAIPLYAPIASSHDHIVGCDGAFQETIRGIHNLIRFNASFEIRIVITALNYRFLPELANFIGWNFPVVNHVAIMGMEIHGMAEKQLASIWVEPLEYVKSLQEAVKIIAYRNIPVSIYNLPHCLVPEEVSRYCRKSISDWKQTYLSECDGCSQKEFCAGFFTTSSKIPDGIHAIR